MVPFLRHGILRGITKIVCVESGDILAVAGGLVIVLVVALFVNPQYLAGFSLNQPTTTPQVTPIRSPDQVTLTPVVTMTPSPVPTKTTPVPVPTQAPPYQIFYTDKPFSYPAYKLPERMDTFGESDIRRSGEDVVTFAYMDDTRGGLTRIFSVPYPVWMLNITVNASRTPQVGNFRMALCYAKNGTIIDGTEILNQGSAYKKIQTSNTDLYIIISTANIERYHIDFLTTRQYFDQYPSPES
jgi:hypothetical protein